MNATDIALADINKVVDSPRFTDTSNAEKVAELYGAKLRFDHKRKRWLIWEGHRWQPDVDGAVGRFAIDAARRQYQEATAITDLAHRTQASKWAIQSESKMRLDATTGIAKNLLPIADSGENWDSDNHLLACKNGVIDLKTGKLRDGRPEDRITMQATVSYEANATAPRWQQFISEIFENDSELIRYIHKALGYSISGSVQEQVAFFCFGAGSNGKSVLFKTIRDILGDYAYDAPASLLQRNATATNSNDVASTEFKRFLVSSETLSTSKLNEQRLKGWTGGDKVTARYLYSEYFSFDPTVKPWLFINHKPQVEDDSFGFWRRVRLIPFNRIFLAEEQDKTLSQKLQNESAGILNWLIEGYLLWQAEGLEPTPTKVKTATQEYKQENDVLAEYTGRQCVEGPELEIGALELYVDYTNWARGQGFKDKDVLTNTAFGRRMSDKYSKESKKTGTFYKGVSLKSKSLYPDGGGLVEGSEHEVVGLDLNSINSYIEINENSLLKKDSNPPLEPTDKLKPSTTHKSEVCSLCNAVKTYRKVGSHWACPTCHPEY